MSERSPWHWQACVKFEQLEIPLFYPRGLAVPLREIVPIDALEKLIVVIGPCQGGPRSLSGAAAART